MDLNDITTKTNAIVLHEMGLTGRGIRVAVLDSGIDINHTLLKNVSIESFQLIEGEIHDKYNHGTHIATILNAISPESMILNIKVLDDKGITNISTIMKGIDLAEKEGANIINISAGESDLDCPDNHPLSRLIDKMEEKGILVCCSAGNSGPKRTPHIPASCKNAIAVGSMNERGRTSRFTSRGGICDRYYPDCVAFGDGILAGFANNKIGVLNGSSQATPQVSGMLALIKEKFRINFTKEEIDFLLSQSCRRIESNEKNNTSGWGAIDMARFYRAVEVYLEEF